jgi:hypothetical protein
MLSSSFSAALDGWIAAVLAAHEAELEGLDPDGHIAEVRDVAGRLADMIPANEADRALQAYVASHLTELEEGLIDGDNPFWLEIDMERHLSPAVRMLVAFGGLAFSAAGWLEAWRTTGGFACAVDRPDGGTRIFFGHKRGAARELDRPSASELRDVLCGLLVDEPARGREVETALLAEGVVDIDAWPGSMATVVAPSAPHHARGTAHA